VATWSYVCVYIVVLAALALMVGPLRSPADVTLVYCNVSVGLGDSLGIGPCSSFDTHHPPPPAVDGPTARRALLAAYNTLMSAEHQWAERPADRTDEVEGHFSTAVDHIRFPARALADVQTLWEATNNTDGNDLIISLPAITAAVAAITRDLIMHRP
jgi:hypothetical protein